MRKLSNRKISLLVAIVSLAFITGINAQSRSFNKFYKQYRWSENSVKVTVPGILIKAGAKIAQNHVDDEMERQAMKNAKYLKKIKVLVLEGDIAKKVEQSRVNRLIEGIEKEKYETLVSVKEGNETVKLYIKTKKDCVRNLIVIVNDDEEFVAVNLKTKIKMEDFNKILKSVDFMEHL